MPFNAIHEYDATVAGNNTDIGGSNIAEGCAPSGINNALRELARQVRSAVANQGNDIASAATTNIGAATGQYVRVTGTTAITSFGTVNAGVMRWVEFTGALTLTHNGTSLRLPGSANIVTATGDVGLFVSLGAGNWKCPAYTRADGKPIISSVAPADITNDLITYAKIQNITASRLLGNPTGSAADPAEISLGAGLAFSGTSIIGAFGAQLLHVRDEKSAGTNAGTPIANAWTKHTLDDVKTNEISGASQASSVITLPAGTYWLDGGATFNREAGCKLRWRNTTDGTTAVNSMSGFFNTANDLCNIMHSIQGRFMIATSKNFELQYYAESGTANVGLGQAAGAPQGEVEIYADVRIWKIA